MPYSFSHSAGASERSAAGRSRPCGNVVGIPVPDSGRHRPGAAGGAAWVAGGRGRWGKVVGFRVPDSGRHRPGAAGGAAWVAATGADIGTRVDLIRLLRRQFAGNSCSG